MEKIPTAEEMEASGKYESYQSMAIAFAKLHVKAALEVAAKSARIQIPETNLDPQDLERARGMLFRYQVSEDSILKAYPLSNIK